MLNIAVLVSGNGSNLQALIDAQKHSRILNGKIVLVISSKTEAYALERAKKENILTETLLRGSFQTQEEYDDALLRLLADHGIDLIVLAGFMTILSNNIIRNYENRIINVHPSLIPAFCGSGYYGRRVHQEVLKRGVKLTGATVHFVNEITDGGPIILQKAVDVMEEDTPEELQKRVMQHAEWELLPKAVALYCAGKISVVNGKTRIKE